MKIIYAIGLFLFLPTMLQAKGDTIDVAQGLQVVQLTKSTYVHISYLWFNEQRIPCNGLVFVNKGEAAVFDTPTDETTAEALIHFIHETLQARVSYLIVNHHHEDCMGGFQAFVGTGCQTIGHKHLCKLAGLQGYHCVQRYFEDELIVQLGEMEIINYHPGHAHSKDNIVSYIPSERVLFGGCMVKSKGAGKGNLADADVRQWSGSVANVKARFPDVKRVVPGHGRAGKKSQLLDYTIELFSSVE